MAMHDQPDLPTPYPVGVNGLGWEWSDLLGPGAWAARNIGQAVAPVMAQTPASQWGTTMWAAAPVVGGANFVNAYTGPAKPNAKYKDTNYAAIYNNPAHDTTRDVQNLFKDFLGIDSTPLAWLTVNWKWIALLGGGAYVVNALMKRKN